MQMPVNVACCVCSSYVVLFDSFMRVMLGLDVDAEYDLVIDCDKFVRKAGVTGNTAMSLYYCSVNGRPRLRKQGEYYDLGVDWSQFYFDIGIYTKV